MRTKNSKLMLKILQGLIEQKSEGIILQKVKSLYIRGRSNFLCKLKVRKCGIVESKREKGKIFRNILKLSQAIQGDQEALITKVDEEKRITLKLYASTKRTKLTKIK